jgi:hypothetical protein
MNDTLLWVVLAVLSALTLASSAIISEYRKHPTMARLFWLRAISLCTALPISLTIHWPTNPLFYICIAALSLLVCWSDVLYFDSAKNFGAGVTTRIEPMSVLTTFVAWVIITPSLLFHYIHEPYISLGIALCFITAGYFARRLRHCEVSFNVMKKLMPVIAINAITPILAKIGMDAGNANPLESIVIYIIVQCTCILVTYSVMAIKMPERTGSFKPNKALLFSAAAMAASSMVHIASKNIAYTLVENPAYITVIGLSAPLFVSLYYYWIGRRDDTDKLAGFGIVISSIILIILTRF